MREWRAPRLVIVGLHPIIDRTVEVCCLDNDVVRGKEILLEPAGKGMNVSRTLANLGCRLVATGYLGRKERDFFEASLTSKRIASRFVGVSAATRHSLTIMEKKTGREIHIVCGPMKIVRADVARFQTVLQQLVKPDSWVVFCGSFPQGVRQRDFVELLRLCTAAKARTCIDTAGGMLRAGVRTRPWLITPNAAELSELTGRRTDTREQALAAAQSLLGKCQMVLASLGAAGAMLVSGDGAWHGRDLRRIKAVHTVGCGDALLAGFIGALATGEPAPEALRRGVACGSVCVRTPHAFVHSRKEVISVMPAICCTEL